MRVAMGGMWCAKRANQSQLKIAGRQLRDGGARGMAVIENIGK